MCESPLRQAAGILALAAILVAGSRPLAAQTEPTGVAPPEPQADPHERLARIVESQTALLAEQGRRIDELEKRLQGVALVPSPSPRPHEADQPLPAAVAAAEGSGAQEGETTAKVPELAVKDVAAEFPRAFKIPGTDAGLRIGGQVRTLLVHSIGAVGTDDRFVTSSIPVEGSEEAGKGPRTNYTVSPSRLNFDLRTPSGVGHLRSFIEADFAGDGRTFRLRHAYGQWGRFVIGQTWSTFSDPEAEPDGIDFEGLNAISLFRQPQLRWTKRSGESVSLALAVENPDPDITGAAGVNQAPDLVGRVRWEPRQRALGPLGFLRSGAHVQAAILARQIRGAPEERPNDPVGTGGIGINVSGRLAVPWSVDRDYITFASNFGYGIGRYISDLGTLGGQDAVYDPATNRLEALPVASAYLGYQHWWSESVRSTATWGGVWVDNLEIQSLDALRRTQRATLNLSWSPIGRIDLVGEFLWGRRINKDGSRGTATQYQLGGVFRF